ncbi:hypothetical protein QYE76_026393 [Lolium multiflorum]|uniref:Peptidase A1 domain-containing protein n=2 Tax=Lolium TaxID=4520 RepID=A0AAD8RHN1_LOLMU|nr:hypothetical protein QYE76_026393 [Lolium multiflorum]
MLRADLRHVDSGRGFTKRELLTRMAARSTARAASLGASAQAATAPVASGGSEYLIHLSIGTPSPQAVALVLDTGSDLTWTQCACTACYTQSLPVFDPSASRTLGTVSCTDPICGAQGGLPNSACSSQKKLCRYGYSYGDKSFTIGTIVEDTFTFSSSDVPSLRFGCGMKNGGRFTPNESGIAGFGRGPLSLPSQLNVDSFSYCFTTIGDQGSSPVFLGTPDNLGADAQSTPFAPTPASGGTSSFYYLSLQGVSVGKTLLPLTASGSDGPIIDSGTSITIFPEAVFQSLREAFVSQVPLPVADASASPIPGMLCFSTAQATDLENVPVPKLILHLEGADWDIPRENYLLEVEDDKGTANALLCVVILSAGDLDITVIGNFQQQNTHIVYDLQANKMNFAPASCDQL